MITLDIQNFPDGKVRLIVATDKPEEDAELDKLDLIYSVIASGETPKNMGYYDSGTFIAECTPPIA